MYSGRVLIGFWLDKLQLESEKRAKEAERLARGELPHQRRSRLVRVFREPKTIPRPPADESKFIRYNQHVLLHAPEILDLCQFFANKTGCPGDLTDEGEKLYGLVLAATASPVDVADGVRRIEDGCGVACIGNKIPAARSVFQLVPATRQSQPNSLISYGSVFFVQLVHASDALYLRSEPPLVDGRFAPRYHNPVRLNRLRDCYAKWRAVHWDRNQRFETEGEPVSPCERIVIQHVMTNQCLAVEHRDWHCSLLGFESGVSVHTYSDLYHNETSECIWNILAEPMDDDHHSAHCRIKSSSSSSSSSS